MAKTFTLDGTHITTAATFFKAVEAELLVDARSVTHWSLDVLDDVLEGGYGIHDLNEPIIIHWTNFRRSQEKLAPRFLSKILDIFRTHHQIELILDNG
ncbi:MAG: barstar family protein [Lewinella sp.]|nr:barstar family protein [Lewinella sp.]